MLQQLRDRILYRQKKVITVNFEALIDLCIEKKASVFINGMEERGRIIKKEEDFIKFEIINKTEKQEDTTKETVNIPICQIFSLSRGALPCNTLSAVKQ